MRFLGDIKMWPKGKRSGQLEDLTGKKFHMWTVLEYVGHGKWKCQCDCGNIGIRNAHKLKIGNAKNCGCYKYPVKKSTKPHKQVGFDPDFIGKRFGKWTVLSYEGYSYWNCRCDCGNMGRLQGLD